MEEGERDNMRQPGSNGAVTFKVVRKPSESNGEAMVAVTLRAVRDATASSGPQRFR